MILSAIIAGLRNDPVVKIEMYIEKRFNLRGFLHHGRNIALCAVTILILGYWNIANADYKIGAGDVLNISVYGDDNLKSEIRVSAQGRITFPLIGAIAVADKSTFQVERMISKLLAEGRYINNAQVTVNIRDYNSQRVSVLGHINKPARYPLKSKTSLLEVIAMAGGIKDSGDDRVIVTRNVNGKTEKLLVDLYVLLSSSAENQSFEIQPGDIIYIPKRPLFYIYGEVQHPGGYPVERGLTVVKALSLGGGLTPRGTQRGIIIKRKNKKGIVQEVDVELTDSVLKDDVVFIDERLF